MSILVPTCVLISKFSLLMQYDHVKIPSNHLMYYNDHTTLSTLLSIQVVCNKTLDLKHAVKSSKLATTSSKVIAICNCIVQMLYHMPLMPRMPCE